VPSPGHSPGHVSFFREADAILIAGDAFVTTRQESTLGALLKWPVVWRPPAYYTCDWVEARMSIERLALLHPNVAITGHGLPMSGTALQRGLVRLMRDWNRIIRSQGRYVSRAAITNRSGVVQLPPAVVDPYYAAAATMAGAAVFACAAYAISSYTDET
jgi:glyoxylase-like metal-dependent hydrolase (beta-lactamase superfamily II)